MAVVADTILSAPGRNRRSVVADQGLRVLIFARLLHGGAGPGSSSQTAEHAWMRALYDMFTTGMLRIPICCILGTSQKFSPKESQSKGLAVIRT